MKKNSIKKLFVAVITIAICLGFLFPIIWMFLTSIKPSSDIFSVPPKVFFKPTLIHYKLFFKSSDIVKRLINTIIIATTSSLISLFLGSMCGYALARLKIRGKGIISSLIIASRAIPPISVVIPIYFIYRKLGILDNRLFLAISYTTFLIPYAVWLTKGFFSNLPNSLEDAAKIDGCSKFGTYFRIILPNILPGLSATLVFCIILAWNELLYALILTQREATTIPVSIAGLATDTEQGALWGPLAAVGSLVILPILIFGVLVQKYLVTGLSAGATKE